MSSRGTEGWRTAIPERPPSESYLQLQRTLAHRKAQILGALAEEAVVIPPITPVDTEFSHVNLADELIQPYLAPDAGTDNYY